MVVRFVEVCKTRGLKFNAGKTILMVLGGEDGLDRGICVDGIGLEDVSVLKYLGCALDESGTDEAECSRKGVSGICYY